jgi:hypothetical protein
MFNRISEIIPSEFSTLLRKQDKDSFEELLLHESISKEFHMVLGRQRQSEKQINRKSQTKKQTRKAPGSSGRGEYYHVEVRRGEEFVTFQTQDVGRRGHIQRVAGRRSSGYWTTVKWLIGKEDAHIQDEKLVPDSKAAKDVIQQLGSQPVHLVGDRFRAKPPPNVPESLKPTPAQERARRENIKKAQAARRKKK